MPSWMPVEHAIQAKPTPAWAMPLIRVVAILLLLCCMLALGIRDAQATNPNERRRVEIGLKIFRATLAADVHLARKLDDQRRLAIVLFFDTDQASARHYRQVLAQPGGLLEYPLRIVLSDDPSLRAFAARPPAAVFITEPRLPPTIVRQLGTFSARHSRLLFSPFEADVERGVATGLFIGSRVRPYVNSHALREAGLELRNFFLGIARIAD
ncbi:hypothetical protein Thiowin_00372 [Thiorhodovibrio winogradskyi]|uniref:Uncharacterized protein n=1 Tax=Thiorhodovibrio winogradskyi TaxID=77007 RepID=A0ABZ0S2P3_9GAMM|nr:hypothetical protein [Thiorhodovibrio winogradskyi]